MQKGESCPIHQTNWEASAAIIFSWSLVEVAGLFFFFLFAVKMAGVVRGYWVFWRQLWVFGGLASPPIPRITQIFPPVAWSLSPFLFFRKASVADLISLGTSVWPRKS